MSLHIKIYKLYLKLDVDITHISRPEHRRHSNFAETHFYDIILQESAYFSYIKANIDLT